MVAAANPKGVARTRISQHLMALAALVAVVGAIHPAVAQQSAVVTAIPSGLVIGPNGAKSFTLRLVDRSGRTVPDTVKACLRVGEGCLSLDTSASRFARVRRPSQKAIGGVADGVEYENVSLSKRLLTSVQSMLARTPQGRGVPAALEVRDRSGEVIATTTLTLYSGVKNRAFVVAGKRNVVKPIASESSTAFGFATSSVRPSRNYKSPPSFDGEGCEGTSAVFNSYRQYLDCADNALAACPTGDEYERASCIVDRCSNTPDQFESFWRTLNGDTKSVGSQYYKNNFGSSSSGEDTFEVALHPCLYDGAGEFTTKFNSGAVVMGDVFPLANAYLHIFHPARTENLNLSRGEARLGFNGQTLISVLRDDFGATTVPFTYQQELFKSFPKTPETPNKVYWVEGVIPVNMVFRPQGVIGMELQARVSPEARFLEVDFRSYADFGTSGDAGPSRDGVGSITFKGLLSLIQAEYHTSKYAALNADDNGMLPSLGELSKLEYWPPKGGFGPICAQWFASTTTHPTYGQKCSTPVDFGALSTRQGTLITARDGSDRLVYYHDYSQGGDDGVFIPYPWRSPILDQF